MQIIENKTKSLLLGLFFFMCGFIVCLMLLLDPNIPMHYVFLPIMPLSFGFCCMLFYEVFCYIPKNLGVTILFGLLFVRNVFTPFAMFLGEYEGVIYLNIEKNTTPAIFLIVWETVTVFCSVYLYLIKQKRKCSAVDENRKNLSLKVLKKHFILIVIAASVLVVCDIIAPEMMDSYRTIFDIGNDHFANFEDTEIVRIYGTTFIKKLAIVLGRYIARALILIFPAWIIVFSSYKNKITYKIIGFCACFVPFFYIAGGIARSLIYFVCLLLLHNYCIKNDTSSYKQMIPLLIGVITVGYWWMFNNDSSDVWRMMSGRLNAYFSGVNIVSGGFNLPTKIEYSVRYFINDFTSTIPFGSTIFGISHETVQSFFNSANYTSGQIPPTISMGNYYFGPILAPVYSVIFAILAVNYGNQLHNNKNMHPMKYIRLLISVFQFSMGIVMYNIEITMTAVFSLILPMYLIEKLSDKK